MTRNLIRFINCLVYSWFQIVSCSLSLEHFAREFHNVSEIDYIARYGGGDNTFPTLSPKPFRVYGALSCFPAAFTEPQSLSPKNVAPVGLQDIAHRPIITI